jgi:hypothetical protein
MRSTTATISAPTSGWNTRDPLDQMDPTYAIKMINAFPDDGFVRTRRGYTPHCLITGNTSDVNTLVELPLVNGSKKLIACAGTRFYDVTTATSVALGPTITNSTWQHVLINNRVLFFNGTDTPQMYDGTTWSQPSFNGHAHTLTPSNLIQGCQYKSRLFVVEKNSAYVWNSNTAAFQGQMHRIDYSFILQRGGTVEFVSSWSRDTGVGLQDYFVIVSSEGEVLLYSGTNPDDANNWAIAGRFYLPEPVAGRRAYLGLGSDLLIIHKAGITPLSALLSGGNNSSYASITSNINSAFLSAAQDYGSSTGWNAAYHSGGKAVYFNIPVSNVAQQFVLNPERGAWAQYTGMQAKVWASFGDYIMFGGTNGRIFQAETGALDNGAPIKSEVHLAYNYFKDRARIKRFTMLRPHVRSAPGETFSIGMDVDFREAPFTYTTFNSGTNYDWNTGLWNQALWSAPKIRGEDVYSLTALGRAASISFAFESSTDAYEFYAAAITYETGGLL